MRTETLTDMAVFVAVAESESFTEAARELGLAKSSISKRIARLEDGLGLRLLNRTTRKISLTEPGQTFLEGCRRAIAEAEAAEQAVSHLAASPRGLLKVSAPMTFGIHKLAPALPPFLESYPELAIDVSYNDRQVDLVEEGFDVAVRIAALADSSLVARRLAPVRRILCAAPRYLELHGRPQHPKDLVNHDCLLYSYLRTAREWRFLRGEEEARVSVKGRIRMNNGDALREACIAGLGIAFMPTFICGDELRAGRLVCLMPEWRDAQTAAVNAVFPAGRNLSPKVRAFIDYLVDLYGEEPEWDRGLGF